MWFEYNGKRYAGKVVEPDFEHEAREFLMNAARDTLDVLKGAAYKEGTTLLAEQGITSGKREEACVVAMRGSMYEP